MGWKGEFRKSELSSILLPIASAGTAHKQSLEAVKHNNPRTVDRAHAVHVVTAGLSSLNCSQHLAKTISQGHSTSCTHRWG